MVAMLKFKPPAVDGAGCSLGLEASAGANDGSERPAAAPVMLKFTPPAPVAEVSVLAGAKVADVGAKAAAGAGAASAGLTGEGGGDPSI